MHSFRGKLSVFECYERLHGAEEIIAFEDRCTAFVTNDAL